MTAKGYVLDLAARVFRPLSGGANLPLTQQPVPDPPTGLGHSNVTSDGWTETWDAPAAGATVTGYRVFVDGNQVGVDLPAATHTLAISGMAPSTTYSVTVRALNETGESAASVADSVTTSAPPVGRPDPPTNVYCDTVTAGGFIAHWSPPAAGATPTGYRVIISGTKYNGDYAVTDRSAVVTGQPAGTYTVTAKAFNGSGVSNASDPVTVVIPESGDAPPGLTAGKILFGWYGPGHWNGNTTQKGSSGSENCDWEHSRALMDARNTNEGANAWWRGLGASVPIPSTVHKVYPEVTKRFHSGGFMTAADLTRELNEADDGDYYLIMTTKVPVRPGGRAKDANGNDVNDFDWLGVTQGNYDSVLDSWADVILDRIAAGKTPRVALSLWHEPHGNYTTNLSTLPTKPATPALWCAMAHYLSWYMAGYTTNPGGTPDSTYHADRDTRRGASTCCIPNGFMFTSPSLQAELKTLTGVTASGSLAAGDLKDAFNANKGMLAVDLYDDLATGKRVHNKIDAVAAWCKNYGFKYSGIAECGTRYKDELERLWASMKAGVQYLRFVVYWDSGVGPVMQGAEDWRLLPNGYPAESTLGVKGAFVDAGDQNTEDLLKYWRDVAWPDAKTLQPGTVGGGQEFFLTPIYGAFSGTSDQQVVYTNLITDPSFELDSNADGVPDGWSFSSNGNNGTVTKGLVTNAGVTTGTKAWHMDATAQGDGHIAFTDAMWGYCNIAGAEGVATSAAVHAHVINLPAGHSAGLFIMALNAGGSTLAMVADTVTTTGDHTLSLDNVVPPVGTDHLQVQLRVYGNNTDPGTVDHVEVTWDSLVVVQDAVAPDYFDGDTPYSNEWTYAWTGTPDASTSTKSSPETSHPKFVLDNPQTPGALQTSEVTASKVVWEMNNSTNKPIPVWATAEDSQGSVRTSIGSRPTPDVLNPSALDPWFEALNNRDTQQANIVCIGDSITEGAVAGPWANRWQNLMQARARARFPVQSVPTPGEGWVNAISIFLSPGPPATSVGSPAQETTDFGLGIKAKKLHTGQSVSFTGSHFDRVHVMYSKMAAAGGSATVYIDDVSQGTLTSVGAANEGGYIWDSGALTSAYHVLKIAGNDAVGNDFMLSGVEFFRGDHGKGIHVYDAGHWGLYIPDFYTAGAEYGHWKDFTAVSPHLTIVNLGTNGDKTQGATLLTQLDTLLAKIDAKSGGTAPILLVVPFWGSTTATQSEKNGWATYVAGIKARATGHVAVYDLKANWPDLSTTLWSDTTVMYDGTHPNQAGHSQIADLLLDAVAPLGDYSIDINGTLTLEVPKPVGLSSWRSRLYMAGDAGVDVTRVGG